MIKSCFSKKNSLLLMSRLSSLQSMLLRGQKTVICYLCIERVNGFNVGYLALQSTYANLKSFSISPGTQIFCHSSHEFYLSSSGKSRFA